MLTKGRSVKEIGTLSVLSVSISLKTRSRISFADLFVKVIARMDAGVTPSFIRWSIRWVIVLVLPAPAPANIRSGPCVVRTASFCCSLSVSRCFIQKVYHGGLCFLQKNHFDRTNSIILIKKVTVDKVVDLRFSPGIVEGYGNRHVSKIWLNEALKYYFLYNSFV